jgi:hypothetical protein
VFTGNGDATLNSTINGVGLGIFIQEEFTGLGDGNLNSTLIGEGAGSWSDQAVVVGIGESTVNSPLIGYGVGYFYKDGKPATNWQELCKTESQWLDIEKKGSTLRSCEDATGDE